jgi:hypothetical protein
MQEHAICGVKAQRNQRVIGEFPVPARKRRFLFAPDGEKKGKITLRTGHNFLDKSGRGLI